MEPVTPGEKSAPAPPSVLRAVVNWSMVATLCSAGGAAALFMLVVLPLSARSWGKVQADLPYLAQILLDYRLALTAGVVVLIVLGCTALFAMKPGVLRAAIVSLVTALLIGITASGIIGWWLMFRKFYEDAGAGI